MIVLTLSLRSDQVDDSASTFSTSYCRSCGIAAIADGERSPASLTSPNTLASTYTWISGEIIIRDVVKGILWMW